MRVKNLKLKKKLKTQVNNSKLKGKTQGLGGTCLSPLPKWCYKKKPELRAVVEIVVVVHGLAVLGWDNVGTRNPCHSCALQVSELVAGSDNAASSLVMIFAVFEM